MRTVLVAMTSLFLAAPLGGQIYGKDCRSENGGRITGTVKDSTGKAISGVSVMLADIECQGGVTSTGVFVFDHVPPGVHKLKARSLWYRVGRPIDVRVFAGKTSSVDIKVEEANSVLDCKQIPQCAAVIKPNVRALVGLNESARMHEVGLRTAFAMTHSTGPFRIDAVPCIADAAPAVVRAVAARLPGAVPMSHCVMSGTRKTMNTRLVEKRSGRNASAYSARVTRMIDRETFDGDVSYYAAPLSGATWECRYKKERGLWIPTSCRMTVIS